jgi:hypothetical protein
MREIFLSGGKLENQLGVNVLLRKGLIAWCKSWACRTETISKREIKFENPERMRCEIVNLLTDISMERLRT